MKLALKIKTLFFIITLITAVNFSYGQNSISGTVRYEDNLQLVTSGVVKAFKSDGSFAASGSISTSGNYTITGLEGIQYDVIGFPNGDPETDFPPTGFPNTIITSQITPILALGNVISKDVFVQRVSMPGGNSASTFISGNITLNNKPISNAIVYAKQDDKYFGYTVSDSKGDYRISSLPIGDYIIIVERIGDNDSKSSVSLDSKGIENFNVNLQPLINITKNDISPSAFSLKQNYPNPFNPSTLISYTVPKDAYVSVKVYNSLGELTAILVNSVQKAGAYSVKFDGANLSSGIYFYTLETAGMVDTRRMVLIK